MTLVSVVIPTYNRTALLMERALPSVLGQTHRDLDIHVVGDGTEPATQAAIEALADPRVRFTNLPHAVYPSDPEAHWRAIGYPVLNYGFGRARGDWVGALADDDAYPPDAIALLLEAAADQDAPFVYGRTEVVGHGMYGDRHDFTDGAFLFQRDLGLRYDEQAWRSGFPADYELRGRVLHQGSFPVAFVNRTVYRYWPAHKVPPVVQA